MFIVAIKKFSSLVINFFCYIILLINILYSGIKLLKKYYCYITWGNNKQNISEKRSRFAIVFDAKYTEVWRRDREYKSRGCFHFNSLIFHVTEVVL
jgi:hypothetical protein